MHKHAQYPLKELLGSGTYSDVYRLNGSPMAVKEYKIDDYDINGFNECDLKEIAFLKRVKHLNIIQVNQVTAEDAKESRKMSLSMTMELCDCNLTDYLKEHKMSESESKVILFQIVNGLKAVHDMGYFHGDLKGRNILMKSGIVKLIDFGLVNKMNRKIVLPATIDHRPLEVMLNFNQYNPRTLDTWSLGCIFYRLVYNEPLFTSDTPEQIINEIINKISHPSDEQIEQYGLQKYIKHAPCQHLTFNNLSPQGRDLLKKMLSLDPYERPNIDEVYWNSYFDELRGEKKIAQIITSYIAPLPDLYEPLRSEIIATLIFSTQKTQKLMDYDMIYLAINLFDRVIRTLCRRGFKKRDYYLFAITCLYIANKIVNTDTYPLRKLIDQANKLFRVRFEERDILTTEKLICEELNWDLDPPTFYEQLIHIHKYFDSKDTLIFKFLCDLVQIDGKLYNLAGKHLLHTLGCLELLYNHKLNKLYPQYKEYLLMEKILDMGEFHHIADEVISRLLEMTKEPRYELIFGHYLGGDKCKFIMILEMVKRHNFQMLLDDR